MDGADFNITSMMMSQKNYHSLQCLDKHLGTVLDAYRQRVTISGLIRYYYNGDIKDITVDSIDLS